ncbi:CDP-alcohol phosphatidyltransferase family protein [Curtobacterium sp. RRHDQ10]|uniref:CDP-alcohol phosphatidyltransferase family protein n=1 Tax=Curtobacterium phyllosphaerae TaxID=3413379 RepID=UPI003BF3968D
MTDTTPSARPDWQTWPNLLTLVRFLLIPVFVVLVVQGHPGWAIITLAVLGVTDWADGFIARRFDQGSALGKMLDPLADRTSIVAIVLSLVLVGLLPWWVVAVVLLVDLVMLAVSSALFHGSADLDVTWTGKIRSALLFVGLPVLLFSSVQAVQDSAPWVRVVALVFVYAGTVGHVVAGFQYVLGMVRKARRVRTA